MRKASGIFLSRAKRSCNVHSFSSTAESPPKQGFRARLESVPVDKSLLKYLDELELGYLTKRRHLLKIKQSKEDIDDEHKSNHKIYPFHRVGNSLHAISEYNKEEIVRVCGKVPQVAVIGRSNVGKSTLINSLVGFDSSYVQKAVVSEKPGETKTLSFYGLGKYKQVDVDQRNGSSSQQVRSSPALIISDLPGYGFAYMSDEDKQRCFDLTVKYLLQKDIPTPFLKRVLFLVDGRHGLKLADKEFLQAFNSFVTESGKWSPSWQLQLVLTKSDLVERMDLCRRIVLVQDEIRDIMGKVTFGNGLLPVAVVSAAKKNGIKELQFNLSSLALQNHMVESKTENLAGKKSFVQKKN